MNTIISPINEKIKTLVEIKKGKGKQILIEGLHLIQMALEAKLVIEVFGYTPLDGAPLMTIISPRVAEKLSEKVTTDGYFALISKPNLSLKTNKHLLYLDNLNDPGNLGTILRTALAFNFGGVLLNQGSVNAYNPKVLSGGQGAHFKLPIKEVSADELVTFKKQGYQIVTTGLNNAVTLEHLPKSKVILVLGNEARGISDRIFAQSDMNVKIDIENIDSLNVAIAGGILMHYLAKRV